MRPLGLSGVRLTQRQLDPGLLGGDPGQSYVMGLEASAIQMANLLGGCHPEASESPTGGYLEKAFQGLPCMSLVISSSEKPASCMAGTNSPDTES